ncbi:AzlD domain-containing protein [Vitreoscilla massiliensis]|uniref:AzlD domain-containing protein n=1 Tax=Vitreoscilla massiliensis TaxID=1689272 RepID=A0ABY4DXF3_9NEIS|nr:AzlD domain-containing protein [Vitreoscilla massiliensis]UOO87944.1 AzlD domain-containing protein [Vitreoscilla massiliensis]
MSNTVFFIALVCMSAITFVLRAAPTLLPRKLLESPWLNALNFALPLSVMMVLILAALPLQAAFALHEWRELLAQILALLLVLLVYARWRNVLVAMVTGVAILNLLLYLFS